MKVVIIGNGVAGTTVASELRKLESDGTKLHIDIYTDESYRYYTRIRLSDFLAGSVQENALYLNTPQWYEKQAITVHTDSPVVSINRETKKIVLADNSSVPYDVLFLAAGASANRPPIAGIQAQGIFCLRTLNDAKALKARETQYTDTAAVIGGGLLGIEAARALKEAGIKSVRVFELAQRLLPRQLDSASSQLLQRYLCNIGLDIVTGVETDHFTGDPLTGIVTKDGRQFDTQTVILSMGVHSNTQLAKEAGLAVNRGIIVNNHLQTTDSAIFSCGDCAEFEGIVWGIVPVIFEQAPIAAKQAYAFLNGKIETVSYVQTIPKTSLKVAGLDLISMGKAVLSAEESASGGFIEYAHENDVIAKDAQNRLPRYEKYVIKEGKLIGAILFGSKEHQGSTVNLLNKPVTKEQIEALLQF